MLKVATSISNITQESPTWVTSLPSVWGPNFSIVTGWLWVLNRESSPPKLFSCLWVNLVIWGFQGLMSVEGLLWLRFAVNQTPVWMLSQRSMDIHTWVLWKTCNRISFWRKFQRSSRVGKMKTFGFTCMFPHLVRQEALWKVFQVTNQLFRIWNGNLSCRPWVDIWSLAILAVLNFHFITKFGPEIWQKMFWKGDFCPMGAKYSMSNGDEEQRWHAYWKVVRFCHKPFSFCKSVSRSFWIL